MINVLLADDQVLFVNSLKDVLQMKDPELAIVGVAYNGRDAIAFARTHPSLDVAVLDIRMQPVDGVEAARVFHTDFPHVKVIMLTTFDDDAYVKQALGSGASGYLLKDMLPEKFIVAIKAVYHGNAYLSQSVLTAISRQGHGEKPAWCAELNEKEWGILRLISLGYNNDEIAEEVHLGRQTTKNYVHAIYEKMGVRDRMQAMRVCIEGSLFD